MPGTVQKKPIRGLAAALTAALNGTVQPTEVGTTSATEAIPALVFDLPSKTFVATSEKYSTKTSPLTPAPSDKKLCTTVG